MANIKLDKQKKTTYSHGQAFSKKRFFGHYLYSDSFNKYLSISYVPDIVLGWGYKRWKYGRWKRGEGNSCNTGIAIRSWVHWNTLNVTETADPWARVDLGQASSKQGLPRGSVVKNSPAVRGAGDAGSIPGSGRSPGGGHGSPLQCSCLENPINRWAWQAIINRVAKSQTQLKRLSMHIQ